MDETINEITNNDEVTDKVVEAAVNNRFHGTSIALAAIVGLAVIGAGAYGIDKLVKLKKSKKSNEESEKAETPEKDLTVVEGVEEN